MEPISDRAGCLSRNPAFSQAEPACLDELIRASSYQRFQPGERVLSQGDLASSIFSLEVGSVRVFYEASSGAQALAKQLRAPAVFGEAEALVGIPHLEHVEVSEPSDILIMPVDAVVRVLAKDARCAAALVVDLAARLVVSIQNERSLAFDTSTVRLANYLLDHVAATHPQGSTNLRVDLTQDDLANAIGVARRSVARDIAEWQRQGIILRRGSRYWITDLEQLRRYSDADHLGLTYSLTTQLASVHQRLLEKLGPPRRSSDT